jgi:hypothetical protein
MSLTSYPDAPFGLLELGGTYLTELAEEIQQIGNGDPLADFLPQDSVLDEQIRVEWIEGELRVLGVVRPGMPNGLNTFPKGKSFSVEPAYFRRGQVIDQKTINHLRQEGERFKIKGKKLVTDQLTGIIEQGNMMLQVLRAQLLSGGIAYQDAETGVSITADSGIPDSNKYVVGSANAGTDAPVHGSTKWHNPASTPVTDLQQLAFRCKLEGRNAPTHIVMNGALGFVLQFNTEIRKYLPGRDDTGLHTTGVVKFGENGLPTRIAGMDIIYVDHVYDDYVSGTIQRRYMWPIEKIALIAKNHPSLPSQMLGATILTKGEHPDGMNGATGIWVQTWDAKATGSATAAPGVQMQVGMSGLPVLMKPKWVHVVTVSTAAELEGVSSDKYVSRS